MDRGRAGRPASRTKQMQRMDEDMNERNYRPLCVQREAGDDE